MYYVSVKHWHEVEFSLKGKRLQAAKAKQNASEGSHKFDGFVKPPPVVPRAMDGTERDVRTASLADVDGELDRAMKSSGRAGMKSNNYGGLYGDSSDSEDEEPKPQGDYFSSIDTLESADFEINPWHRMCVFNGHG